MQSIIFGVWNEITDTHKKISGNQGVLSPNPLPHQL